MEKILIVDDSIVACSVIQSMLTQQNFEVLASYSGADALLTAIAHQPDLILLDIILPSESGYDVCRKLKSDPVTSEIPIVFITSIVNESNIAEGFACGAVDYLCKPFSAIELLARVGAHIKTKQMRDLLKRANEELENMNRQLAAMVKEKELWGKTDQLTKLYNRHYVTEMMPLWNSQLRNGRVISVVMADIDNFKIVNDTYGHAMGDYLLQSISNMIRYHCGSDCTATRWGGEEFLIVAPDMDLQAAYNMANLLRERISLYPFKFEGTPISRTITMGVAEASSSIGFEKSVILADTALYDGKRSGKNRVVAL